MKFDAAQITKLARETGFPADNLEKVLRLRELLTELHKHPFPTVNSRRVKFSLMFVLSRPVQTSGKGPGGRWDSMLQNMHLLKKE